MLNTKKLIVSFLAVIYIVALLSIYTHAAATGAQVTNVSTSEKNASDPDWNNQSKGAIHTIRLNAEQQDMKWKAYVGNVSSTFVLDDEDDYSIFRWTMTDFTGQVYITRDSGVNWGTVDCATAANKEAEDSAIGFTSTSEDSVNSTFTSTAHKNFVVGTNSITNGDCFSVATYANDTSQTPSPTTPFTEVLLWDTTGSDMIYTTFVENDAAGYRNNPAFQNVSYDFQAIVPDDPDAGDPTFTYYFYLELTSS